MDYVIFDAQGDDGLLGKSLVLGPYRIAVVDAEGVSVMDGRNPRELAFSVPGGWKVHDAQGEGPVYGAVRFSAGPLSEIDFPDADKDWKASDA